MVPQHSSTVDVESPEFRFLTAGGFIYAKLEHEDALVVVGINAVGFQDKDVEGEWEIKVTLKDVDWDGVDPDDDQTKTASVWIRPEKRLFELRDQIIVRFKLQDSTTSSIHGLVLKTDAFTEMIDNGAEIQECLDDGAEILAELRRNDLDVDDPSHFSKLSERLGMQHDELLGKDPEVVELLLKHELKFPKTVRDGLLRELAERANARMLDIIMLQQEAACLSRAVKMFHGRKLCKDTEARYAQLEAMARFCVDCETVDHTIPQSDISSDDDGLGASTDDDDEGIGVPSHGLDLGVAMENTTQPEPEPEPGGSPAAHSFRDVSAWVELPDNGSCRVCGVRELHSRYCEKCLVCENCCAKTVLFNRCNQLTAGELEADAGPVLHEVSCEAAPSSGLLIAATGNPVHGQPGKPTAIIGPARPGSSRRFRVTRLRNFADGSGVEELRVGVVEKSAYTELPDGQSWHSSQGLTNTCAFFLCCNAQHSGLRVGNRKIGKPQKQTAREGGVITVQCIGASLRFWLSENCMETPMSASVPDGYLELEMQLPSTLADPDLHFAVQFHNHGDAVLVEPETASVDAGQQFEALLSLNRGGVAALTSLHAHVVRNVTGSRQWYCDVCQKHCTMGRDHRYRCGVCDDFDACEECHKQPHRVNGVDHAVKLVSVDTDGGWICNACGALGFPRAAGANAAKPLRRFRCYECADFDLCAECVRGHIKRIDSNIKVAEVHPIADRAPAGICHKQRPRMKTWVGRFVAIEGRSLNFYTKQGDARPRGSSIADVGSCRVAIVTHNGHHGITLKRKDHARLPDLDGAGYARFYFMSGAEERDRFARALSNLAAGREWMEPAQRGHNSAPYAVADTVEYLLPTVYIQYIYSSIVYTVYIYCGTATYKFYTQTLHTMLHIYVRSRYRSRSLEKWVEAKVMAVSLFLSLSLSLYPTVCLSLSL